MIYKNTIFVILGGGLVINDDGSWRTTTFTEGDEFGAIGDRYRIEAAHYAYTANTDIQFLILGGKGQLKNIPDAPSISEVMRQELTDMGVPADKITIETESGNTYQQLQALSRIIAASDLSTVVILTNRHHVPRVDALMQKMDEFSKRQTSPEIIIRAAEDMVIQFDPGRSNEFDKAYATQAMKDRVAKEEKGVHQIQQGTYKLA